MTFDFDSPSDIVWVHDRATVLGLPYIRESVLPREVNGSVPVHHGFTLLAYHWNDTHLRTWSIDPTHDPHRPRACADPLIDPQTIDKHVQSARWQVRRLPWRTRRWLLRQRNRPWWEVRLR
jgi:hypothetical protein